MQKISDRVYWLPPAPPDRPSLCAVVGERRTLMLDGGSSAAHARLALDGLAAEGIAPPSYVAITHSHWDHVFGASAFNAPVIAHALTAETLVELAATDWSDEALDGRVAAGEISAAHAAHVKEELPAPRDVQVAPADIVIGDGLDLELGGVTVRVRHVGGDHASDSCVMYVEPDGVLFLGDCLYDSPGGALTADVALPLHDTIRSFGAQLYFDGHSEAPIPPAELGAEREKMLLAERFVREAATDGPPEEAAVVATIREQTGREPDGDLQLYVHAFVVGSSRSDVM